LFHHDVFSQEVLTPKNGERVRSLLRVREALGKPTGAADIHLGGGLTS